MAFPAEGMEAAYRNNIDHVASLLKEKHNKDFTLYNLSNRAYDYSKFGGQVNTWCGFPDHHPPPLLLLFKIVKHMHNWLLNYEKNIAVIHCLVCKLKTMNKKNNKKENLYKIYFRQGKEEQEQLLHVILYIVDYFQIQNTH